MRKYFLILFFIIQNTFVLGQIDSLENAFKKTKVISTDKIDLALKISSYYYRKDNVKNRYYLNYALNNSKKLQYKRGELKAYSGLIVVLSEESKLDSSIQLNKKAQQISKSLSDEEYLASFYTQLGNIFDIKGNLDSSLFYYLKANEIQERRADPKGIGMTCMGIGNIYFMTERYNDALSSFRKSYKNLTLVQHPAASWAINNLASTFESLNELDSALYYYHLSVSQKEKNNDQYGLSYSYHDLGSLYRKKGNLDLALKYLFKALKTKESFDLISKESIATTNVAIADIYLDQKKYEKAKSTFLKALKLSIEGQANQKTLEIYKSLYITCKALNNTAEAFEFLEKYVELSKQINDENNQKNLVEMQTKYETTEKQHEIELLDKQNQLQQLKLDKQNQEAQNRKIAIIIISTALVLLIISLYIVFKNLQTTKKQKLIIEEQKELLAETNEELNQTNEEILAQRDEIERQKHIVEEKHEEIQESITYAKRIQEAILPPSSLLNHYLPGNFVLYKPKDVVAGDFYWLEIHDDIVFFAVADCTGHGVPGAMVSVVCHNALNRAVREFSLRDTGKILDKVRELVLITFEKSEQQVKDGMDICLCAWNKKDNLLQFSGANNPLYVVKNGVLETIKGTKQPIGYVEYPIQFEVHTIDLSQTEAFYLSTDGYADQFGGPENKKFGYKQFRDLLNEHHKSEPQTQKSVLKNTFDTWVNQGKDDQIDDVCVMGIVL